jgi:hypothetical protein
MMGVRPEIKLRTQYERATCQAERHIQQANKRCVVCHKKGDRFERFTPCDENCKVMHFWNRDDHHKVSCWRHQPIGAPRFHVKYCSLRCYNSWEFGHNERRLQGVRVRQHRYMPGYRARRQEQRLNPDFARTIDT